jgi:cell division septal protein FtsQ
MARTDTSKTQEEAGAARRVTFQKEMYIPKKTLQKKGRSTITPARGEKVAVLPRRSPWRGILVFFLWLCFMAEGIYLVFFMGFFRITSIQFTHEGAVSEQSVEGFVRSSYQGKFFNAVNKDNVWFVNTNKLSTNILERYPKLKNVTTTIEFPGTIHITLIEKPYQLVWCTGADCFLLTDEGALRDASVFFERKDEQGKFFTLRDESSQHAGVNEALISKDEVAFIGKVAEDFTLRTGFEIDEELTRPSRYAQEIRLHTKRGFWVYINTKDSLDEALNNMMLLLQKQIPENEWEQLNYIDLRTENRIYYTRKDKKPELTEEEKKKAAEEEEKKAGEAGDSSQGENISGTIPATDAGQTN